MKISMEHIHNMYRQNEAQSVKKDENEYGINRKRNFDEIKISAQTEMIPGETEFAKILAEKLSAEVRQEAPAEKLDILREKIQSGCYEIVVSAIASRILLEDKGDS